MVLAFRRVLERAGEGMGVSQAVVRELKGTGPQAEARKRILLGIPINSALLQIIEAGSAEASMLASLVIRCQDGSVQLTGKRGEELSYLAERWVKTRENQRLEANVRRSRGLIASGVCGAVSGMIATIGPLLGSLSNLGNPGASGASSQVSLLFPAATMALLSSGFLGVYTSGKGFYQNILTAGLVYLLVSIAVAPLANLPPLTLAIK